MAAATVLISEADPDVRRLLVVLMRRLGHEPVVYDGAAELDLPPRGDVLLLEPESERCVAAARRARLFHPELPIVCMGRPPADGEFLDEAPLAVIEKPFTVRGLEAVVDRFVPARVR
jgi:hypothetical protein